MFVDAIISSFLAACHHYCAVPGDWGAEHCRVWLLAQNIAVFGCSILLTYPMVNKHRPRKSPIVNGN